MNDDVRQPLAPEAETVAVSDIPPAYSADRAKRKRWAKFAEILWGLKVGKALVLRRPEGFTNGEFEREGTRYMQAANALWNRKLAIRTRNSEVKYLFWDEPGSGEIEEPRITASREWPPYGKVVAEGAEELDARGPLAALTDTNPKEWGPG
jgi:hypothetical protein